MTSSVNYDVIVVGGGIAGACIAGVLARGGLGVLCIEKEATFRDRIRGESTYPWGMAEARAAGLGDLIEQAGVSIEALVTYKDGSPFEEDWRLDPLRDPPCIGFFHPQMQEAAFSWATAQGATMLRPAKAVEFSRNGRPSLSVTHDGALTEYAARLVIGADGKHSMARRWTGGESVADPEHHRMGGVAITGAVIERTTDNVYWDAGEAVNWFAAGPDITRLYLIMTAQRLRETSAINHFASILAYAAEGMPAGSLDRAQQAGPIGYFSSADTWGSILAGNGVALIGDAAGSPDPCQGHGTPMLFRDVRQLSELLLHEADWDTATAAYAAERERIFAVVRAYDLWHDPFFENSDAAKRLREGNDRARQQDPSLGGFAAMDLTGPASLVADDDARRHYFGEDLA